MSESNRKPIVVVVAVGAIAVLVLVIGVSCGGGNDSAAPQWQKTFAGLAKGTRLVADDLKPLGNHCSAAGSQLVVQGSCTFVVAKFGGLFELGPPTKRARLVSEQPVAVTLHVEGTQAEQELSAGKGIDLTFGTSGGRLSIACGVAGSCVLQLLETGG
jgi:hypothetical protein